MIVKNPRILAAGKKINTLVVNRQKGDEAYYLAVGEVWSDVKDDPDLKHYRLTDLAPDLLHTADWLTRCSHIWLQRARLPKARKWAIETNYALRNDYEPYRSAELLRAHARWLETGSMGRRSVSAPIRQVLTDHSDIGTGHPTMSLPLGGALIHGDCFEVLTEVPAQSVHLVYTDMPYGHDHTELPWDNLLPLEKVWQAVLRVLAPHGTVVFHCCEPLTSKLIVAQLEMYGTKYAWKRPRAANFLVSRYQPMVFLEDVIVFNAALHKMVFNPQALMALPKPTIHLTITKSDLFKRSMSGLRGPPRLRTHRHPTDLLKIGFHKVLDKRLIHTQKPVALAEYFIKTYSDPGDTVLDFCIGSGTSAVAAIRTGRRIIGIEANADHYRIACDRVASLLSSQVDAAD